MEIEQKRVHQRTGPQTLRSLSHARVQDKQAEPLMDLKQTTCTHACISPQPPHSELGWNQRVHI